MNRSSFVIAMVVASLLLASAPVDADYTPNQISLTYTGSPGSNCDIDVLVTNNGTSTITVWNVTVVLLFPVWLGDGFLDPNRTYSVFLGEHEIIPGESYNFHMDSGMPDWRDLQLLAVAFVNISAGISAKQTYSSYAWVNLANVQSGLSFSMPGWISLLPFLFFFGALGSFAISYYAERPYWDLWIKERIDQKGSNQLIKWRWFAYRWVDEGRGMQLVALYIGISLFFAVLAFLMFNGFR